MEPPLSVDRIRALRRSPEPSRVGSRGADRGMKLAMLAHLILAAVLLLQDTGRFSQAWLMVVMAVPLSQASLIAIGAAFWRAAWPFRVAAAAAGSAWAWLVAIAVLPGIGARGAESAAWAAGLVIQAAIVLVVASARSASRRCVAGGRGSGEESPKQRLQFGTGSLLAWTAVLAGVLSFGRTSPVLFGWNAEVIHWTYFGFPPVLGAFNAAYALAVLFAVAERSPTVGRITAAGLGILALACVQPSVFVLVFGQAGGLTRTSAVILAGTQALVIYATVAFGWRRVRTPPVGHLNPSPSAAGDSARARAVR